MKKLTFLLPLLLLFSVLVQDAQAGTSVSQDLLVDTTFDATATGSVVCLPRQADDFVLFLKATNLAGSSPTLDVVVSDSVDQTNWRTLDTFTQVTSSPSTQFRTLNSDSVHVLKCLKVTGTLGGTASPSYNLAVRVYYRVRN